MQPFIEQAQDSWGQGLSASDVANNPNVQAMLESLQRQSGELFNEQIAPELRRSSISGGMYGGGRSPVGMGIGAGKAENAFNDAAAKMMMQTYGQGLQHEANLLNMSPQIAGLGMLPGQELMQAGQMDQTSRINELNSQINRGNAEQQQAFYPINQHIANLGAFPGAGMANPGSASGLAQGVGVGSILGGGIYEANQQGVFDNMWGSANDPLIVGQSGPVQGGISAMATPFDLAGPLGQLGGG
jgi:hypothetical protein